MKIKDIAVFSNAHIRQASEELVSSSPPIQTRLIIADDLAIDILPREESLKALSACEPRGYNFEPQRQFGELYSFVRTNPPESPPLEWDSDERLQLCIGLSRIIHPTTISFEYASRIRYENEAILDITPGPIHGFGSRTWLSREDSRDWLTKAEGINLGSLFQAFQRTTLSDRVRGSLWYLEYAFRTYFIDVRWPLVCIGLEYLVHTDLGKSTRQFATRVAKLAEELGKGNFDIDRAREAYQMRSTLVHGQLLRDLEQYKLSLYEEIEELLRLIIERAILDEAFAGIFSSAEKIKDRWPIE